VNTPAEVGELSVTTEAEISGHAVVRSHSYPREGLFSTGGGPSDIHLFCVRDGKASIKASFIPHDIQLHSGEAVFLAMPGHNWNVEVKCAAETALFSVVMDTQQLHLLLNPGFDEQRLRSAHNFNMRDLMKVIAVSPALLMCFEQLVYHKLQPAFDPIFKKAKFLEIFSLLMDAAFGRQPDKCPVVLSPAIETKIHQVRRHITQHPEETPDPDHLALLYDLPRNTLREGYRYLYGKTIHQYHADHKLESARQMLASGEWLVKEVAFKIGYHNPSHFIAAFKKRYGMTPREFMTGIRAS
jgi:AraC-like DNA-binding protein